MEYDFAKIAERIRTRRKSLGVSQNRFIEMLNDIGVRISRNRLSRIENDGEQAEYTLDFLLGCCKLFDCDLGYLLGEYDESRESLHYICEHTGLTEKALQNILVLNEYNSRDWGLDLYNDFVGKDDFIDLVCAAIDYTNKDEQIELVGKGASIFDRTASKRDIASLKIQRMLFKALDEIQAERESRVDNRWCYRMLYGRKLAGEMSEEEFKANLEKLDNGDFSEFVGRS